MDPKYKKIIIGLFFLVLIFILLYFFPFVKKVEHHIQGYIFYADGIQESSTCCIDITGKFYHKLFDENHFDGTLSIDGIPMGGTGTDHKSRWVFVNGYACTTVRSESDGIQKANYTIALSDDFNTVIIDTTYDWISKEMHTFEDKDHCLIVAPSSDFETASSLWKTFTENPNYIKWNFKTWEPIISKDEKVVGCISHNTAHNLFICFYY